MGQRGRPRHPDVLTPREQEVLALVRDGLTNEQIAARLGITFETAKTHVSQVLAKLGVATREEAAAWRPETAQRWSIGRNAVALAGVGIVAAAVAGLALLAWGLSRSDEGDDRAAVALSATPVFATSDATPSSTERAAPSSTPSGNTAANLLLRDFWLADANNGWIGGASRGCKEPGTPCVGVIFHTANGGGSWTEQYSGDVQVTGIAFDGQLGFAVGTTGKCEPGSCDSGLLRTTDGGQNWTDAIRTGRRLDHLTVIDGDAWVLAYGCAPGDIACTGGTQLLASADSGASWDESSLPDSLLPRTSPGQQQTTPGSSPARKGPERRGSSSRTTAGEGGKAFRSRRTAQGSSSASSS